MCIRSLRVKLFAILTRISWRARAMQQEPWLPLVTCLAYGGACIHPPRNDDLRSIAAKYLRQRLGGTRREVGKIPRIGNSSAVRKRLKQLHGLLGAKRLRSKIERCLIKSGIRKGLTLPQRCIRKTGAVGHYRWNSTRRKTMPASDGPSIFGILTRRSPPSHLS